MNESVEQAAPDWQARANREAAAIIDGMGIGNAPPMNRTELIGVIAIAWIQGTIFGEHRALGHAEQAFDRLRDAL